MGVVSEAALDEVGAVLDAVGVVSEAALDEVGVVTVAASIREVEVDLEAGMVIADVVRATLGADFENKAPTLGVWSVKESEMYQRVVLAGVEHVGE